MADSTLQRDVALNVIGKIEGFAKTMGQVPGVTEKQAAKAALSMQKAFTKEYADIVKKADKAANDIEKEFTGGLDKIGGVAEKLGPKLGGVFGEASDAVFDFILPLKEAASGLGGAAGGALALGAGATAAVAAVGLLAAGAKSLADGALEARDRLIEQGHAAQLPPESLRSLKQYESATGTLTTAMDTLTVVVGGALADDLAVLARNTADLVQWTTKASGSISEWSDSLAHYNLILGATIDLTESLWGSNKELTLAEIELDRAQAEAAGNEAGRRDAEKRANQQLAAQSAEHARAAEQYGKDAKRRAEEEEKAAVAAARAYLEWQSEAEETFRAASVQDYVNAFDPALRQLDAMIGATSELGAQTDALLARNEELIGELEESNAKRAQGLQQIWEVSSAAIEQFADDVLSLQADARAKDLDGARKDRDKHKALLDDLYAKRADARTKDELAEIDSQIAQEQAKSGSYDREIKAAKQRSQNVAKAQKAAALAGIAVNTGEAIIKAFALFGPPPSPVGIGAAAAALAAGGLEAGIVAATPLPTFFSGTSQVRGEMGAGEVPATLHRDESVLNSGATRDLGADVIDALNAGLSPFSAARAGDVYLDGKKVGRVLDRHSRKNSRKPTGFRSPYGRN